MLIKKLIEISVRIKLVINLIIIIKLTFEKRSFNKPKIRFVINGFISSRNKAT
jgi:hypothetical protein